MIKLMMSERLARLESTASDFLRFFSMDQFDQHFNTFLDSLRHRISLHNNQTYSNSEHQFNKTPSNHSDYNYSHSFRHLSKVESWNRPGIYRKKNLPNSSVNERIELETVDTDDKMSNECAGPMNFPVITPDIHLNSRPGIYRWNNLPNSSINERIQLGEVDADDEMSNECPGPMNFPVISPDIYLNSRPGIYRKNNLPNSSVNERTELETVDTVNCQRNIPVIRPDIYLYSHPGIYRQNSLPNSSVNERIQLEAVDTDDEMSNECAGPMNFPVINPDIHLNSRPGIYRRNNLPNSSINERIQLGEVDADGEMSNGCARHRDYPLISPDIYLNSRPGIYRKNCNLCFWSENDSKKIEVILNQLQNRPDTQQLNVIPINNHEESDSSSDLSDDSPWNSSDSSFGDFSGDLSDSSFWDDLIDSSSVGSSGYSTLYSSEEII